MIRKNSHTKQYFDFVRNTPHGRMFGTIFLCCVLRSCLGNSMITPGMRKKTVSRLNRIPFDNTIPMSYPSRNCIMVRAIRPEIVVRLDDEISRIALDSASTMASLTDDVFSASSWYRWLKMIA